MTTRSTHVVRCSPKDADGNPIPGGMAADVKVMDFVTFRLPNGEEIGYDIAAKKAIPFVVDRTGDGQGIGGSPANSTRISHMARLVSKDDPTQMIDVEVLDAVAFRAPNNDEWVMLMPIYGVSDSITDHTDSGLEQSGGGNGSATRASHVQKLSEVSSYQAAVPPNSNAPQGETVNSVNSDYPAGSDPIPDQNAKRLLCTKVDAISFNGPNNEEWTMLIPEKSAQDVDTTQYDDQGNPPENTDPNPYVRWPKDSAGPWVSDQLGEQLDGTNVASQGPFWWIKNLVVPGNDIMFLDIRCIRGNDGGADFTYGSGTLLASPHQVLGTGPWTFSDDYGCTTPIEISPTIPAGWVPPVVAVGGAGPLDGFAGFPTGYDIKDAKGIISLTSDPIKIVPPPPPGAPPYSGPMPDPRDQNPIGAMAGIYYIWSPASSVANGIGEAIRSSTNYPGWFIKQSDFPFLIYDSYFTDVYQLYDDSQPYGPPVITGSVTGVQGTLTSAPPPTGGGGRAAVCMMALSPYTHGVTMYDAWDGSYNVTKWEMHIPLFLNLAKLKKLVPIDTGTGAQLYTFKITWPTWASPPDVSFPGVSAKIGTFFGSGMAGKVAKAMDFPMDRWYAQAGLTPPQVGVDGFVDIPGFLDDPFDMNWKATSDTLKEADGTPKILQLSWATASVSANPSDRYYWGDGSSMTLTVDLAAVGPSSVDHSSASSDGKTGPYYIDSVPPNNVGDGFGLDGPQGGWWGS